MMRFRRWIAALMTLMLVALQGCAYVYAEATAAGSTGVPKYVFLFIGDGMTYPQVQLASYYLKAMKEESGADIADTQINFTRFEAVGSATTYSLNSVCTDSAAAATAIASGHKTSNGTLNMDEEAVVSYPTIAEQLKEQKGYRIGLVTTVNSNHATPAGFYARQSSRHNYYDIGLDLIDSGFDYIAGGSLKNHAGDTDGEQDLYDLAAENGYLVVTTQQEAALTTDAGRTLVIAEQQGDAGSMSYEIDRQDDEWALKDYVSKGIELLDNENGFFLMCEGGKIDQACHNNDAGSALFDLLAFQDAVQTAVDFAAEHPDETLIVVTGDHETGGLTLGCAQTQYNTYFENLQYQTISYARFDSDYVSGYVENQTSFADAMGDVEALFGLCLPERADQAKTDTLILTDEEVTELQTAYDLTLQQYGTDQMTEEQYEKYGNCEPLTVTVTHLLDRKSGIDFTTYAHTGLPAAVYASGVGAETFEGNYDNTDIYHKLASLLQVTEDAPAQ